MHTVKNHSILFYFTRCQLCGMSYDRKHKLEYHLASAHNKIDTKLSQNQELGQPQQPIIEYFQEVREYIFYFSLIRSILREQIFNTLLYFVIK